MSIVFCIPFVYPHKKHIPHAMEWYAVNKAKYDLELHWEMGRPLHQVQRDAVEKARAIGASHVLWTEHDHWGYPEDGLDHLLAADKDVIGHMTYMRNYPFLPMNMRKVDPKLTFLAQHRNLRSFYPTMPIEETDLLTWAFTLTKVSVFDRMEEAGLNPWQWNEVPTDSYFCQYCEDLNIPRYVHAGFCVNHGDVPKEQVPFMRRAFDAINAANGNYLANTDAKADTYTPQNEEDPHGVVPYQTELETAIEAA